MQIDVTIKRFAQNSCAIYTCSFIFNCLTSPDVFGMICLQNLQYNCSQLHFAGVGNLVCYKFAQNFANPYIEDADGIVDNK